MPKDKEEMSDEEFGELLTKQMKKKGIPYHSFQEVIRKRIGFRDVAGDTPEERSLERWLNDKDIREELRSLKR